MELRRLPHLFIYTENFHGATFSRFHTAKHIIVVYIMLNFVFPAGSVWQAECFVIVTTKYDGV